MCSQSIPLVLRDSGPVYYADVRSGILSFIVWSLVKTCASWWLQQMWLWLMRPIRAEWRRTFWWNITSLPNVFWLNNHKFDNVLVKMWAVMINITIWRGSTCARQSRGVRLVYELYAPLTSWFVTHWCYLIGLMELVNECFFCKSICLPISCPLFDRSIWKCEWTV